MSTNLTQFAPRNYFRNPQSATGHSGLINSSPSKPFQKDAHKMAQALVTRGQASLLCSLPPETIMSIAQLSSLRDHNNLSRTCQFLRFVLQPELFRHDGALFAAMRFGCEKDSILPIQQALGFAFSPTVDHIFPDSNTMLSIAAFHGSAKVVRYLLSLNADTTHRGTDDLEPLGLAWRGCFDAQPVPAEPTDVTDSPKMKPCGVPYADVLHALLDAGANAHFRLPRYATIPDLRHDLECEMGLDEETLAPSNILSAIVDAHDYNRLTSEEAESLMRQFVTKGVSADRFSSTTLQTTLTFAVQQFCDGIGSFGLIELLLDNGADPRFTHLDYEVATKWSALGAAIKNKNPHVVRYLLSRGAFPALTIDDPLEGDPIPPLWYAIHWSDEATIKALLDHGSSNPDYIGPDSTCRPVEYYDYQDVYCYHYLFAPLALAKAVVRQGASVHKEEVIRLLLLHGANPNLRNTDGRTPLMMALTLRKAFHRPYMVEVLLQNGADPNASPIKGVKPLGAATYNSIWDECYTTESERLEIVDMLVKAGANSN
jgi:ankyrin repeat protein